MEKRSRRRVKSEGGGLNRARQRTSWSEKFHEYGLKTGANRLTTFLTCNM